MRYRPDRKEQIEYFVKKENLLFFPRLKTFINCHKYCSLIFIKALLMPYEELFLEDRFEEACKNGEFVPYEGQWTIFHPDEISVLGEISDGSFLVTLHTMGGEDKTCIAQIYTRGHSIVGGRFLLEFLENLGVLSIEIDLHRYCTIESIKFVQQEELDELAIEVLL